jgi:hypothetical protein
MAVPCGVSDGVPVSLTLVGVDDLARRIEVPEEFERDLVVLARQNGDVQPGDHVAAQGFEFRKTDTFGRDLEAARKAVRPCGGKERCPQTQQLVCALLAFACLKRMLMYS